MLYPFISTLEHLGISVHQASFLPVRVFFSSSPWTLRSQRPGDTLEVGCWLEFNDAPSPEQKPIYNRLRMQYPLSSLSPPPSSIHKVWLSESRQET